MEYDFDEIYSKYRDIVYGYLFYMARDEQIVQDLSQETFFKIYKGIKKFKGDCSIKTWCLTIARNTFLSYAKRKKVVMVGEEHIDRINMHYENIPEEMMLKEEKSNKIKEILFLLDINDRTLLLLRDYEKLSYKDIAEIIGVSETIIKGRIFRARNKYKQLYSSISNREGGR